MVLDLIQEHRRARLLAAAEKVGGKAALGRLLGYKDGAFIGQMLRGERAIKEDTVHKLEQRPGFKGWFALKEASPSSPPPAPNPRFEYRREVSESDFALLQDIRVVLEPEEIDRIRAKARALEERALALLEEKKSGGAR